MLLSTRVDLWRTLIHTHSLTSESTPLKETTGMSPCNNRRLMAMLTFPGVARDRFVEVHIDSTDTTDTKDMLAASGQHTRLMSKDAMDRDCGMAKVDSTDSTDTTDT